MNIKRKFRPLWFDKVFIVIFTCMVAAGCGKEDPNDYPVSHWLNDNDLCVRASAKAIIDSGIPYPNFGKESVVNKKTGKTEERIKTVDVWVGDTRIVIPAEVAYSNGAYPKTHPRRYESLRGTLPNFYPVGPAAPVKDGMGPMVDVKLVCSMRDDYISSWSKVGYKSNEEDIAEVKTRYEEEAKSWNPTLEHLPKISVNYREDLKMTEVLHERTQGPYGSKAIYWPMNYDLRGLNGSRSGIGCEIRHDPDEKRYGGRGWRCAAGIRFSPSASASVQIYVAHINEMPAVYEQVKRLLVNAKQPTIRK